jgi:hypothetical protein
MTENGLGEQRKINGEPATPILMTGGEGKLKGSVQRKLRWVKNDLNRSVGASDCGAGHSFVVLFGFHLGFTIFPFPVSTVQIIGKFWKNR